MSKKPVSTRRKVKKIQAMQVVEVQPDHPVVPYDENLLERARTQWQFGDWDSLTKIERDALQHHPDRAKLALLAAAGHLQTGNAGVARQFIRLAHDWGCNKKLVSQILIAGVHNSLGRAAAVTGQQPRAIKHFERAIVTGAPGSDARLLTQARINEQSAQLGLPSLISGLQTLNAPHDQSTVPTRIAAKARECLHSEDVHDAVDAIVASGQLSPSELVLFHIELSDQFVQRNDKLTALHFLQTVRDQLGADDKFLKSLLIQKFIALGRSELAADIAFRTALDKTKDLHLGTAEKTAIQGAYDKIRMAAQTKSEHGHDLLLAYLQSHLKEIRARSPIHTPVLIEIGTTRENVPGQGSTRKIAEFCKKNSLQFITVDMDPHNTRMGAEMFSRLGTPFKAITAKGEDYLRDYQGSFDAIFLDAYDFDHGQHSELRQNRYKKYLGNPISEATCHQMHLDCAESILTKLSPNGVVCLDDTWLVDGKWTAKGTLAMPFLLNHGFKLLEARNRAALLARAVPDHQNAKA